MRNRIGAIRDALHSLAGKLEDIRLDIEEPADESEQAEGTEESAAKLLDCETTLRRTCVRLIDDALRALPD